VLSRDAAGNEIACASTALMGNSIEFLVADKELACCQSGSALATDTSINRSDAT
jgi:hypothetical protein